MMFRIKYRIFRMAGLAVKLMFSFFSLQDTVFFSSFSGAAYSDNPRAISEKLYQMYPNIRQVWALKKTSSACAIPEYVKVVKYGSLAMIKEAMLAKVWVDNGTKSLWLQKRHGQLFINTWHGGVPIKVIGASSKHYTSADFERDKHSFGMTDIVVSNSRWFTEIVRKSFPYNNEIIEIGSPRNDVFFDKEYVNSAYEEVRNELKIPSNTSILLYAPTFREDGSASHYVLNFEYIRHALAEKTGNNWAVLVRLHHYSSDLANELGIYNDYVINVTSYPDMQKLMMSADCCVTDYSSAIFDYALLARPGFLYADDLEDYLNKERGLNFDLRSLPFCLALSEEELCENLISHNESEYQKRLESFFKQLGLVEAGSSCQTICTIIMRWCQGGTWMEPMDSCDFVG